MKTQFCGRRGALMRLAFTTSLRTVLTLGFYRFWAKTRLRRWYWSAIRPGGVPLEYVGEPLEKLMGFLIAVVFLAFYIGIVNLVLMFLSYSLLSDNFAAYALSFIGLIPFWFYARYRARRYILARTRWRGMRFGQGPGAWGYARRALGHWLLTIVTLGLLAPRQTFWLEKYRTDRTFFGNARLEQGGRWPMLWPAMRHIFIAAAIALVGALVASATVFGFVLIGVGVLWLLFGLAYYRVRSFSILADNKCLAGGVGFSAHPRAGRILRIYIFGNAMVVLLMGLALVGAMFAIGMVAAILGASGAGGDLMEQVFSGEGIPGWFGASAGIAAYFLFFIIWGVLGHAWVSMPLLRHYAETLEITNPHRLAEVAQRPRDEFAEAEGFADALDVGAAI